MKRKLTLIFPMLVLVFGIFLTACDQVSPPAAPAAEPVAESETQTDTTDADDSDTEADADMDSDEAADDDSNETAENEADADENEGTEDTEAAEASMMQTFQILEDQSEARFKLDEVLRGSDFTVVGITPGVTGEIMLDPSDPSATQIGTIQIDARALATDSNRRDGAIRRFVLGSNKDEFQFITFTPTTIDGLPEAVAVGDSFDIQITGDLFISGETRSETFTVTVTVNSETEISGSGTATILHADYGLFIPDVPFVASVEDDLILEIDFVAAAQ
ncbi:MAG: YceI family protein [Chloroflexota bacterium]